MRILKFLLALLAVVALGLGGVALAARYADGPLGIVAGGPFTSGRLHAGPELDWQYVKDMDTVEFQLLEPARSRTTWILEHDRRIFIPSGYMNSPWGKLWKQWPPEALRDGRAILRVGQTLYLRQLVRVDHGPLIEPLVNEINRKYQAGATVQAVSSGALWLFELKPR